MVEEKEYQIILFPDYPGLKEEIIERGYYVAEYKYRAKKYTHNRNEKFAVVNIKNEHNKYFYEKIHHTIRWSFDPNIYYSVPLSFTMSDDKLIFFNKSEIETIIILMKNNFKKIYKKWTQ